jgi:hypothetical protein
MQRLIDRSAGTAPIAQPRIDYWSPAGPVDDGAAPFRELSIEIPAPLAPAQGRVWPASQAVDESPPNPNASPESRPEMASAARPVPVEQSMRRAPTRETVEPVPSTRPAPKIHDASLRRSTDETRGVVLKPVTVAVEAPLRRVATRIEVEETRAVVAERVGAPRPSLNPTPSAAPVPSFSPAGERLQPLIAPAPPEPVIQVTIGRIEVRAERAPVQMPPSREPKPSPTERYLDERRRGGRR